MDWHGQPAVVVSVARMSPAYRRARERTANVAEMSQVQVPRCAALLIQPRRHVLVVALAFPLSVQSVRGALLGGQPKVLSGHRYRSGGDRSIRRGVRCDQPALRAR